MIDSEIRYYPWETTRYTSGTSPTTFQYTGQRVESSLGLLFYNARWYDPSLGRFLQADTIVPGGVQGLDRYAYVGNNPLKYINPTGHGRESTDCGPDGIYCDSRGKSLSNAEIYDVLVDEGFMSLPDASVIYDSKYNNLSRVAGVLANYDNARKALFTKYGWGAIGKYMNYSGKLNDDVFMAMIIQGEFASESGEAYDEALEALSNQYYREVAKITGPMQCNGSGFKGCTFNQQLLWATQMQAWYSPSFVSNVVNNDAWMMQQNSANSAIGGYQHGADKSWFWGDVSEADKAKYNVTAYSYNPVNEPKPYFIVYSNKIYGIP